MSFYEESRIKIPELPFRMQKHKKQKRTDFVLLLIGVSIISMFAGFLGGAIGSNYFSDSFLAQINSPLELLNLKTQDTDTEKKVEQVFISQEDLIVKAVEQASPSVVSIVVTKDMPVFEQYYLEPFKEYEDFFGREFDIKIPQYRQKGTEKKEIGGGTGFVVSKDGLILTNKHVVTDKDADYTVLTNTGQTFPAKVLARDPIQDIAILKITTQKSLPVIKLGDSNNLQIGQTVIAIGNVLGEFRNSISVGVISGLGRNVTASGGGFSEVLEDIIQTDAAINPGNSGGPLLNLKGEVIGINTAVAINAQSVGFTIPINRAKKDIEQVKAIGRIAYPFLGIYYTVISADLQKEYDLKVNYGAWIGRDQTGGKTDQAIFSGSPAEKAGLQQDDIILEFNNEKIDLNNPLSKIILKYNPGDEVVLKFLHEQEEKTVNVILDEMGE